MQRQRWGRRNEGDEKPEREGPGDARAVKGPALRPMKNSREWPQKPVSFQGTAIGCDSFQSALHAIRLA
jgi:hypothetical protein